jgi:hypothetical protein
MAQPCPEPKSTISGWALFSLKSALRGEKESFKTILGPNFGFF